MAGEPLNMAFLASRHSSYTNAVAKLHGVVTRRMAQPMWPGYPLEEVPIGSVTNGIHTRSWISMEMSALLTRYLARNGARGRRIPLCGSASTASPIRNCGACTRSAGSGWCTMHANVCLSDQAEGGTDPRSRRPVKSSPRTLSRSVSRVALPPTSGPPCCSAISSG